MITVKIYKNKGAILSGYAPFSLKSNKSKKERI
jgi:hypothetical protein